MIHIRDSRNAYTEYVVDSVWDAIRLLGDEAIVTWDSYINNIIEMHPELNIIKPNCVALWPDRAHRPGQRGAVWWINKDMTSYVGLIYHDQGFWSIYN